MKALTFLEWFMVWDMEACEHTDYAGYVNKLGQVSVFYSQPFKPEMITELFEGWEQKETGAIFNQGACGWMYHCFRHGGGSDYRIKEYDNADNLMNRFNFDNCKTLNDFISDCQRTGIELTFKKEIADKYFS